MSKPVFYKTSWMFYDWRCKSLTAEPPTGRKMVSVCDYICSDETWFWDATTKFILLAVSFFQKTFNVSVFWLDSFSSVSSNNNSVSWSKLRLNCPLFAVWKRVMKSGYLRLSCLTIGLRRSSQTCEEKENKTCLSRHRDMNLKLLHLRHKEDTS